MRLEQVVFRCAGEALQQKRLNLVLPHQVHNLLVGQDRIAQAWTREDGDNKHQRQRLREMVSH